MRIHKQLFSTLRRIGRALLCRASTANADPVKYNVMKLTQKQKFIYETIKELVEEEGCNPTTYRVAKYMEEHGMKTSVKSVSQVVEALVKKNLITRDGGRKIYPVEQGNFSHEASMLSVPLYGLASCGEALAYAEDNVDGYLQVSQSLFRKTDPVKLFAVQALGDSMDRQNIEDGSYVIFEKHATGTEFESEIVVAIINGMATIKRFKGLEDGVIGLFPDSTNPEHQPIYIHEDDDFMIAGVLKRVLPAYLHR